MPIKFEEIVPQLEGVEWRSRDDVMALCPAHDDKSPSLHVTRKGDDSALLHCFAGCEFEAIVRSLSEREYAIGMLEMRGTRNGKPVRHWYADQIKVPYVFLSSLGVKETDQGIIFPFGENVAKVRLPPGARSKFQWVNGNATTHRLWPVPPHEIDEEVWICEGETDCLTLRFMGFDAYAITGGAHDTARLSAAHYQALAFRGARRVIIVGDADSAGQAWAKAEAKVAQSVALEVHLVDLTRYYDPFGTGIKDVNDLWQTCQTFGEFASELKLNRVEFPGTGRDYTDAELLAMRDRDVAWLIPDLIARRDKVIIAGPPKTYKTWLLLELVRSLTEGTPFLQNDAWRPAARCKVLFVEEEGDEIAFAKRRYRVLGDDEHDVRWWIRQGVNLTQPGHVDHIIEIVQNESIDVVVLDPWQRMAPGVDENSAAETGVVWDEIHRITRFCRNTAVVVVHHANKAGGTSWESIRGSSRFGGEVDLGIFVQKANEPNTLYLGLDGRDIPPYVEAHTGALEVEYEIQGGQFSMKLIGKVMEIVLKGPKSKRDDVLQFVRDNPGCTRREVEDGVSIKQRTALGHLSALRKDGKIEYDEKGETWKAKPLANQ